ncbi:phosphatidylglycerophosphatase A [bacterium]|nr:phosphatidylglycerophosphatase A [bacterium]
MTATSRFAKWEKRGALVIATGVFAGYWPFGPGTLGTILALPIAWLLGGTSFWLQIAFAGALFAVGVWASERAIKALKRDDAPQIVIDEVVGYLVAVIAVPFTVYWLAWGFCLFRFFDIFKPFPISWLDENVKGGWGVMLDDVAAGLFANLVMHLMMRASL